MNETALEHEIRDQIKRGKGNVASPVTSAPASNGRTIAVDDGTWWFVIEGGPHDGERTSIDGYAFMQTAEQIIRRTPLEQADERLVATEEFGTSLARSIQPKMHPLQYCTPTMALQAWSVISDWYVEAQKKTRQKLTSPTTMASTPST